MSKKPKKRFYLNEKQLGYAMVIPSLILVLVIVIYPIMMSFWNSLFEYRLNDPSLAQKMVEPHIDLERYADNYYFLAPQLDELVEKADKPKVHNTVENIEEQLSVYHEKLLSFDGAKEQYNEIMNKLNQYLAVKDDDLKYMPIEGEFGQAFSDFLQKSRDKLSQLSKNTQGPLKEELQRASGLTRLVESSFLEPNFVGFSNYKEYIQKDRTWSALWNTTIFTVASVFFELIFGLMIALIINRAFIGRGAVRASVLIPWAIPTAVSAMMWKFLYDGQSGIVAHYFEQFGLISQAGDLLTTGGGAMVSVILADVWKTTPYMALLLLAGLQTIPHTLYEAADVDGAGKVQQFFKITLPMLKSAILVALLFRALDAFRVFDLIYVLTGGGPANSTESISIYAYEVMFSQQNFGEGSVLSIFVFISVAIISVLCIKLIGSDLFENNKAK